MREARKPSVEVDLTNAQEVVNDLTDQNLDNQLRLRTHGEVPDLTDQNLDNQLRLRTHGEVPVQVSNDPSMTATVPVANNEGGNTIDINLPTDHVILVPRPPHVLGNQSGRLPKQSSFVSDGCSQADADERPKKKDAEKLEVATWRSFRSGKCISVAKSQVVQTNRLKRCLG